MRNKRPRSGDSFLTELDLKALGLGDHDYRWDIDHSEGFKAFKQVPLQVFEHLMDDGLSREDLALLFVLLGYESKSGVCNPSHETIAQCLGWKPSSRTHVHDAVKRLKARNMLRVTRTKIFNRYDLSPWLQSFSKYEIKRAGNGQEMFVAIPCYVLKHGPRLLGIQKFLYILLLSSFKNDSGDPDNHGVVIDEQAAQRLGYKSLRQIRTMRKELEEHGYLTIKREEDRMVLFSLHGVASACRDAAKHEAERKNQKLHCDTLDSTMRDTGLLTEAYQTPQCYDARLLTEIHQTPQEVEPTNKTNVIKPSVLTLAKARENNNLVEEVFSKDDSLSAQEDYDWSFHFEQADSEAFYDEDTTIWFFENLNDQQANLEINQVTQRQNDHLQRTERLPSFDGHYRAIPVHQTVGA